MTIVPTRTEFRNPLLFVLGTSVGFSPNKYVPCRPLLDKVYSHMGFNPKALPFDRKDRTMGSDQRIRYAFSYGDRQVGSRPALTQSGGRGLWGLTKEGVKAALKIKADLLPGKGNLTSRWLAQRLRGAPNNKTYAKIVARLTTKLNVSASGSFIKDHVQEFFLKLIQRDALSQRILDGSAIYDSHLVCWAERSAQNDIRSMATNPVCRTLYGARTATERRKEERFSLGAPRPFDIINMTRFDDEVEQDKDPRRFEIVSQDESPEVQVLDSVWWDRVQDKLVDAIRGAKVKPEVAKRYVRVFDRMVEGWRIKEIAESLGMSPSRSNSTIGEIRTILRAAYAEGAVAL